ncbi:MAG: PEBP family protein [Woeseiaceae bacterium]
MTKLQSLWLAAICLSLTQPGNADDSTTARDIDADLWADNWFALYLDGELLAEDPVKYNTERSFNAESFSFSTELPANFSLVIKDFKETDSGLEYIGSRRQQMGDGGFAAQFFDANSGELLATSNESWRCITIHRAPLNRSCERSENPNQTCESDITPEPDGWKLASFDDSSWPAAVEHSANAVRPHGGFDSINWQPAAKLIWSADLEIDNTVLCRFTLSE